MLLGLLLLLFVLCLYRVEVNLGGFHADYLSKPKTDSVKGFFIVAVLFKHAVGYLNDLECGFEGLGDHWFVSFNNCLGQLMVVMFLFYSGYGISESFKQKGEAYLKRYPTKRILTTLLNFDVAVMAFVLLDWALGIHVTTSQVLLSLTGWENVGNSNWYIFVIIICYVLAWVALRLPLRRWLHRAVFLFVLCFALLLVLSLFKDTYWFDTLMAFPAGFMFSACKDRVERFLQRWYWLLLTVLALSVAVQLHGFWSGWYVDRLCLTYNTLSITFGLLVVMLTMKVGIGNGALQWLGVHLFPIYIYMRIPMMIMVQWQPGMVTAYPAAFVAVSLVVTLLIAWLYRYWQIRLR